jgi:SAM-dependent methyltransferase
MLQELRFVARSFVAMGSEVPQNFLGARWVPLVVNHAPGPFREDIALRMLALSPHYFYRTFNPHAPFRDFVRSERDRNRDSRRIIAEKVLLPHFRPHHTVLDYGCGPGFLAHASARFVSKVLACDISEGVLSCARVLNSAPNLRYLNVATSDYNGLASESVDVAYSFAVAQHMRDDALMAALRGMARLVKANGKLLLHVVLDSRGWRTEAEWDADRSMRGRVKAKYGLNCFSRDSASIRKMVELVGFTDVTIGTLEALAASTSDDIVGQHLVVATKAA